MGVNKEDFYIENFVFDICALIANNLNPFGLDRKMNNQNKHEFIDMTWKERMPPSFYKHICLQDNFLYMNGRHVLYLKVSEIINYFFCMNEKNYVQLRNNLSQIKKIFQYVCSNICPKIYFTAVPKKRFRLEQYLPHCFQGLQWQNESRTFRKKPSKLFAWTWCN